MRIKGIISNELMRTESAVYVVITPTDITPGLAETFSTTIQEDIDNVMIVNNLMCEHKDFTLFAAMPAMALALGDTIDIIAEVREQYGDYFVMPNYSCNDITHSKIYYEKMMKMFWDVVKESAII